MAKWELGGSGASSDGKMIPTRFTQSIDKDAGKLNNLSSAAKVVAALSKALSMQGKRDGNNYYIDGDELYCPRIVELEGGGNAPDSYQAQGRFLAGCIDGDEVSNLVLEFDIRFEDADDEMGLPDLRVTGATIEALEKSAPLNPEGDRG